MNDSYFASPSPVLHPGNAIWDDGEWVSWDEINRHIEMQERQARKAAKAAEVAKTPKAPRTPKVSKVPGAGLPEAASKAWNQTRAVAGNAGDEAELLERMIGLAKEYLASTGRHLPIYGEIGELYAQQQFGIKRHKPCAKGSDGRIGATFVEVKTITPMKGCNVVQVKRAGNFGKLIVVKIDAAFRFEARVIDRSKLSKGSGKFARVSWSSMPEATPETPGQSR